MRGKGERRRGPVGGATLTVRRAKRAPLPSVRAGHPLPLVRPALFPLVRSVLSSSGAAACRVRLLALLPMPLLRARARSRQQLLPRLLACLTQPWERLGPAFDG